jgi:hypothetical protein
VVAGAAACASTPTLDAWTSSRDHDFKEMAAMSPADKAGALRHRIMLDRVMLNNPADRIFNSPDEERFKTFYLTQPVYTKLAEDYVALGDALGKTEDEAGALLAYEDAVSLADGYVFSAEAAARARVAAFRGEQQFWESHGEPARSAAARLLADAQASWADTPDAQQAKQSYESLLQQSHDALQEQVNAENAQTLASVNAGLNQMQSSIQQAQAMNTTNMTPQQRQAAVANQVAQMTPQLLQLAEKTATLVIQALDIKIDPKALAMLEQITQAVPGLVDVVKTGKLDAFVSTVQGKQVVGGLVNVLGALRRGDPHQLVDRMTADLATVAAGALAAAAPAVPPAAKDVASRLLKLKQLLDQGLITADDFKRERERILKEGL